MVFFNHCLLKKQFQDVSHIVLLESFRLSAFVASDLEFALALVCCFQQTHVTTVMLFSFLNRELALKFTSVVTSSKLIVA